MWPFTIWDVLRFTLAYTVLCGPFWYCGLIWLAWFFTCVYFMFVAFEVIASNVGKKTLSDTFWDFEAKCPKRAWACIGGMSLFWLYIVLHFIFKI
jgi:hypothetical protein